MTYTTHYTQVEKKVKTNVKTIEYYYLRKKTIVRLYKYPKNK